MAANTGVGVAYNLQTLFSYCDVIVMSWTGSVEVLFVMCAVHVGKVGSTLVKQPYKTGKWMEVSSIKVSGVAKWVRVSTGVWTTEWIIQGNKMVFFFVNGASRVLQEILLFDGHPVKLYCITNLRSLNHIREYDQPVSVFFSFAEALPCFVTTELFFSEKESCSSCFLKKTMLFL